MVTSEFPPFGAGIGNHVSSLAAALIRTGVGVRIVTRAHRHWTGMPQGSPPVYAVACPPVYPFHIRLHNRFVENVIRRMSVRPDLVHLHSPLVYAPETGTALVTSVHGTVRSGLEGTDITDLRSLLEKAMAREFLRAERSAIASARILLPVSEACALDMNRAYQPNVPTYVVNNGVDVGFYQPNDSLKSSSPLILFAGRIVSQKGVDELLLAAARVLNRWRNATFVLAGIGPDLVRARGKARSLGIQGSIKFAGLLDKNQLRKLYHQAWLFVLPSRSEGMPSAVLEAMASGLPIVATEVGGIAEAVRNEREGILVRPRDPGSLATSIESLLESEQRRAVFGEQGRKRAVQSFSWDVIASRVRFLYEKLA